MDQQPVVSLNVSGQTLQMNLSQLVFEHRQLLQLSRRKEEAYFLDYIPPARDAISLPRNVVYVLIGVVLVLVATYAIVGHLIKDLMHDLADWILGPKPVSNDAEEGGVELEEVWRHNLSSNPMENDDLKMEMEKDGLLPGFHSTSIRPTLPTPLRSSFAPSHPGEKQMSSHSVTFACTIFPYVTSL